MDIKHRTVWITIFLIRLAVIFSVKPQAEVDSDNDIATDNNPPQGYVNVSVKVSEKHTNLNLAFREKNTHSNTTNVRDKRSFFGFFGKFASNLKRMNNERHYRVVYPELQLKDTRDELPATSDREEIRELLKSAGRYLRIHKYFDCDHRVLTMAECVKVRNEGPKGNSSSVRMHTVMVVDLSICTSSEHFA